ncbi:MAG TPA: hypothetical protein DC064_12865 [Cyanobacteria bacterium UBA9273]|nr:hypothetical protein [Cyanobacteria bacterium UBA9273]
MVSPASTAAISARQQKDRKLVKLVVSCWLLVVGCWLLVVGCWLFVVGCWLFVKLFISSLTHL